MRLRRENLLWNLLLGSGVYLLDSLRNRITEEREEISDRTRDYGERPRRVAREFIRGEDHHGLGLAAALLVGVGVGVGVGVLLAPTSGEETRNTIANKVQEFRGRVKDKFAEGRSSPTGTFGS